MKAGRYLILAMVAAVYLYPFVRIFSDAPDYGVFLNGADLLSHGAVPSLDFVEPQGPGSFLWLALFFRLFGTSLETARALLSATGIAMAMLTFYLSRRLGATGLFATVFVLTMSVPLMPINSPHYDSNLFALAALAIFVASPSRPWKLALSAVLCGITTWTVQQKGFYLAAALLISLIVQLRMQALKPALTFAGTYGAIALLPFAFFASAHALPDVWFANFVWPITTYSDLNAAPYGFPMWHDFQFSLSVIPFLLVLLLPVLLPITALCAGRQWFGIQNLPYWLAAYALWFSELHRLDLGHLRNGVILMATLFFCICEAAHNKLLRYPGLCLTICAAVMGTANFRSSWDYNLPIQTRRGTVYARDPQPLLAFLETHTQPHDELFVYPYQPIYYFAENLRNPTRYSYLQYHLHIASQFHDAVDDLERKKVRYVIYDTLLSGKRFQEIFPAYRHPEDSKLIMEPYLESHYRLVNDLGRFHVLERLVNARSAQDDRAQNQQGK